MMDAFEWPTTTSIYSSLGEMGAEGEEAVDGDIGGGASDVRRALFWRMIHYYISYGVLSTTLHHPYVPLCFLGFDADARPFRCRRRWKPYRRGKATSWRCQRISDQAAAVFLILFLRLQFLASERKFGIIIDGGSMGMRIHVISYGVGRGGMPMLDLGVTTTMRVNPGLSAYADEPEMAGESLAELLDFARGRVPRRRWGETEIHLMAMAGLRLLEGRVQERLLEFCRNVLKASGFRFQPDWASVITGTDEGIYAWVTANYALGTLGGDPQHTTGIIELGGASAQVTFVSSEPFPPEFARALQFGKTTYNIYSHGFLHFGQNVAHESLNKLLSSGELNSDACFVDPCSPRGYSGGMDFVKPLGDFNSNEIQISYRSGNFSQCRSASLTLLQSGKDKCLYKHCRIGSSFVPALQGKFLATENFYFTSKFTELSV